MPVLHFRPMEILYILPARREIPKNNSIFFASRFSEESPQKSSARRRDGSAFRRTARNFPLSGVITAGRKTARCGLPIVRTGKTSKSLFHSQALSELPITPFQATEKQSFSPP